MEIAWDSWAAAVSDCVRSVSDTLLLQVAEHLKAARLVLVAGNGGSHALASHAAQALMKPGYAAGGGKAAVCLSDGVPTLTAHANDGGWVSAMEETARPFLREHRGNADITMLLFSSSGRSGNICKLAQLGRDCGTFIVTFTGFEGKPLRTLADLSVHVDSHDYEVVEPVHDALMHRVQYHLRSR